MSSILNDITMVEEYAAMRSKRYISRILVIMLLLAMMTESALAATIKVTSYMHIRRGPGEKYSIVSLAAPGKVLQVSKAKSTDGTLWFKITAGKYKGRYISSQRTTTVSSKVKVYVRSTSTVYFRSRPTGSAKLLHTFGAGKVFLCTGYRNGWFRIRYNGQTGYIYGYHLCPA